MKKILMCLVVLLFLVNSFQAQALLLNPRNSSLSEFRKGSLEEALFEDANDGHFDRLSLEQAALIASGVSQRDLLRYIQKIDSIYNHIALRWPMKKLTPVQKGQVILYFLHRTTLKNYQPAATELQKALDQGEYNCVSSTLLFNILCARFDVRTTGIEVPTHVYSAVLDSHPKKEIYEVQTTTPQGFWVTDQTHLKLSEFISHPHLQTWKGKRHVAEVALIAVIYYNRGIDWIRKGDYIQALPFYRRAFRLDPHFPNLTSLLAELYTGVGNQFFEKDDYAKAIQMYREGLSFFAQRKDRSNPLPLSENLTAAFINQANLAMNQKKWHQALALLQQAQNIGFFRQTILHNRKAMYYAWGQDHIDQKNWHEALSVYRNARKEFPQEKGFHQNLSWTYAKIGEELFKGHQFKKAKEWYALAYRETGEPNFMKVKKWLEKV